MSLNPTRHQPSGQPAILQALPKLGTGGVERGTLEMAAAIHQAGWRSLVTCAGGSQTPELIRSQSTLIKLPLHSKDPITMYLNAGRVEQAITAHGVSLVHARSRAPAWSCWWAIKRLRARGQKIPFVTTFHGLYKIQNGFKRRYNAVMTKGDYIIAISDFIAQHLRDEYQVPPDRIKLIPRGVDLLKFNPETVSPDRMIKTLRSWHVPEYKPLILLPARFTSWKGHRLLIDALLQLRHLDWYCVMIGEQGDHPSYVRDLEEYILSRSLGMNIRLLPAYNDMPAAYMVADVVVAPSLLPEAFGRVPAEAQAMGRPIIAADHGGARETIIAQYRDNWTGYLHTPGSASDLAECLQKALKLTDEQRRELAWRQVQHIRENYTKERMTNTTLSLYAELLQTTPQARAA